MGESIVRIAQEHGKTPQVNFVFIERVYIFYLKAVVKMENYHRLHATLSRLKIPVLDSIRWVSLGCMVLSHTTWPGLPPVMLVPLGCENQALVIFKRKNPIFLQLSHLLVAGVTQSRNTMTPCTAMSPNTSVDHWKR